MDIVPFFSSRNALSHFGFGDFMHNYSSAREKDKHQKSPNQLGGVSLTHEAISKLSKIYSRWKPLSAIVSMMRETLLTLRAERESLILIFQKPLLFREFRAFSLLSIPGMTLSKSSPDQINVRAALGSSFPCIFGDLNSFPDNKAQIGF